MTDSHLSRLELERHVTGERLSAHVKFCEQCAAKVATMEREGAKFSSSPASSSAKDKARLADRRWKQRAAALTLVPVAALALFLAWPVEPRVRDTPLPRQAREMLEPRGGATATRLRSLPIRGHTVDFGQGSLEAATNDGPSRPFTLTHTRVNISVTGFMQSVTVTQIFTNPFTEAVEAVYVFPLPEDSAVHDMELKAGERIIRASIQKKAEARAMYEQAKSEGRRAALLDQQRPNIFTQSVANLQPGEKVEVTIAYVAPLKFDDGVYTLNFPMTVGPRYSPASVTDADQLAPPLTTRSGRDIEVHVNVDAGTVIEDLWSVSHRLEVDRPSSASVVVDLNRADTVPNKDLILRWRVSGPQSRAALLAGGGAFALMLNPEARSTSVPMKRELVFLIDTSCSMTGEPLEAAKKAMSKAMNQLQPGDTFMLIDFADRASSFSATPLEGTRENVANATKYLQALPASGGTNQLAGIRAALARPEEEGRLRLVLLMTDGFIGNEEEIFQETRRLRGSARVFGFGIGSSVNHHLLSTLSEEGRGFYQYVRTDEDPTEAVNRFVKRIERPLLRDLTVDWGGLEVVDVMPYPIPDLFDAQPLIIMGRYRSAGRGTVTLKGTRGSVPEVFEVPVTLPEVKSEGRALQMAWARRRVDQLRVPNDPDMEKKITSLALEYHLVTQFTSLVAVEEGPTRRPGERTVNEPAYAPEGVEAGEVALQQKRFNTIQVIRGSSAPEPRSPTTTPLGPPPPPPDPGRAGPPRTVKSDEEFEAKFGGDDGKAAKSWNDVSLRRVVPGDDDFDNAFGSGGTKPTDAKPTKRGGYIPPAPGRASDVPDAHGLTGSGRLSNEDVSRVVLAATDEWKKCSTGDREMSGTVMINFTILPDGSVNLGPTASPEPLASSAFAKCVLAQIQKLKFRASTNGQKVNYPFTFGQPGVLVRETLQPSDIMEVVLAHKDDLSKCVTEHKKAMPDTSGKLILKWNVLVNGSVTNVELVTTEFVNTPIASCISGLVATWKFPKHLKQSDPVVFPFRF
ncbi:MAG: VIT domain-containing protein [Archangium sp.]